LYVGLAIIHRLVLEHELGFYHNLVDEDTIGPNLGPHAPNDSSPIKGLITKGMLKRIQMGLPQRIKFIMGFTLFSWAKEDIKI